MSRRSTQNEVPGCLVSTRGGTLAVPAQLARGLAACPAWELVVDLVTGRLIGRGGDVSLCAQDLARGLLELLVEAGGEPVSAEVAYERVWKARWVSGSHHRAAVQVAMSRVRGLFARLGQANRLIWIPGAGYALRLGERCIALRRVSAAPAGAGNPVLAAIRERGYADNRELRRRSGLSRSAIWRELRRLVGSGRLVPVGRGRAVRYVLAEAAS